MCHSEESDEVRGTVRNLSLLIKRFLPDILRDKQSFVPHFQRNDRRLHFPQKIGGSSDKPTANRQNSFFTLNYFLHFCKIKIRICE